MLHQLNTLEMVQSTIINNKSTFIVKNTKTENQMDFTVVLSKENTNSKIYYVYLKHTKSYYIGSISVTNVLSMGEEKVYRTFTISKNIHDESIEIVAKANIFSKLIEFIYQKQTLPVGIEFYHTGLCRRCGKKLTQLKYVDLGIGPNCLKNEVRKVTTND
jgi:hypothetical protein